MDIDRSSFSDSVKKISFWNGQLIEYTTTYAFIDQVIEKLAVVVAAEEAAAGAPGANTGPGGHVEAAAVRMAHATLLQIIEEGRKNKKKKFGSNTAITTGCQVPMLFYYYKPSETQEIIVEIVFPPRFRDSYESVVAMDHTSLDTSLSETGYTKYYILCPEFTVPFTNRWVVCSKVLFFCNYPSMKERWFNFPEYDYERSAKAIGENEGTVQSSMVTTGGTQPDQSLSDDDDDNDGGGGAAFSEPHVAAVHNDALSEPRVTAHAVTSSGSLPPPSYGVLGNAGDDSRLPNVKVKVDEPEPQSFFRSIFNKCVSYFFSARVGVGDSGQTLMNRAITQTQTLTNIFYDDGFNVDKLLIGNALELADEFDRAHQDDNNLLVHAARHALYAVSDLIGAFKLDETNTELQVMIKLARAAAAAPAILAAAAPATLASAAPATLASAAPATLAAAAPATLASADADTLAAAAAPATQLNMVRNCVHVAAFAVRGVACICACENAERGSHYSQMLSELSKLTHKSYTIGDVAKLIDEHYYNNIVIKQTQQAFAVADAGADAVTVADAGAVTVADAGAVTVADAGSSKKQKIGAGRLRSRRYLHRVSRKRQRTLKKKNLSRKYSKYSSGCDGSRSRSRSLRRSCRRSYSRKISNNN
jgi:hypothetical protein